MAIEEDQGKSPPVPASGKGYGRDGLGDLGKDLLIGTQKAILRGAGLDQKRES